MLVLNSYCGRKCKIVSVRKSHEIDYFCRPRPTEGIKMGFKRTGCEFMVWIGVAEEEVHELRLR